MGYDIENPSPVKALGESVPVRKRTLAGPLKFDKHYREIKAQQDALQELEKIEQIADARQSLSDMKEHVGELKDKIKDVRQKLRRKKLQKKIRLAERQQTLDLERVAAEAKQKAEEQTISI